MNLFVVLSRIQGAVNQGVFGRVKASGLVGCTEPNSGGGQSRGQPAVSSNLILVFAIDTYQIPHQQI